MDSPGQVTSSSFPAQAVVELRARPPSDMVTPASNCRRVGVLRFALRFVLSLIIVLASCVSRPSAQDHLAKSYVSGSCRDTGLSSLALGMLQPPIRIPGQTDNLTPSESVPRSPEPRRELPSRASRGVTLPSVAPAATAEAQKVHYRQ